MPAMFTFMWGRLTGMGWWRRFHVRAAMIGLVLTLLVVVGSSALIVPLEAGAPNATITSFPLALWWAVETATTVGYGDMYPVTLGGRIIATLVMVVGITAFSLVTAAIATWFVGKASHDLHRLGAALRHFEKNHSDGMAEQLRSMHDRFDRLERHLEDRG